MAPPKKLVTSAAAGTAVDDTELATIWKEGVETYVNGLRRVTHPFTSIAEDYRQRQAPVARTTAKAPVAQMTAKPNTQADIASDTQATPTTPSSPLPQPIQQTSPQTLPPPQASNLSGQREDARKRKHNIEKGARKRRHDIEEEECESDPKSGGDVEIAMKKANGRGPQGQKAGRGPQGQKAIPPKAKDALGTQEKRLKESSTFEPTSAFRRKAGVNLSAEEKRLVGIDDEGSLSNEDADKSAKKNKKRKRPTAADWDDEYPDTTSEVPADGGLDDEQLISIGLDNGYSIKTRWVKAPYVWNKKGILYQRYQRLVNLKNGEGDYLWPGDISKKYLGMEPDTWRSIQQNKGFFTAKGVPRQRQPKQLVPVRESNGKFKQASDTHEGREISASTRFELIYNKLIEPGTTSMKRMRNARARMEAVIEEALASNVASQKWGKEMAGLWHDANKELLKFKDAAVKKIMELEDKTQEHETCDASTQTELTPSDDGLFHQEGPVHSTHEHPMVGGLEASQAQETNSSI